jgi:hypothetical protein
LAGGQRLYISTGNYYSAPSGLAGDPGTGDAVLALDARTGSVAWQNQLLAGDVWTDVTPYSPTNQDADVADSPKIFRLADGTKVVSVGQKSGVYYVLNAATGAPVSATQLEVAGLQGGLFANGAVDQSAGRVFANGLDWPGAFSRPPVGGDLYAVSLDGHLLWDFPTPGLNLTGVAVGNGVVYFQSLDGYLYALDDRAGDANSALLTRLYTGGNLSGPAVSNGHLYEGTAAGDGLAFLLGQTNPTGSIIALGVSAPGPAGGGPGQGPQGGPGNPGEGTAASADDPSVLSQVPPPSLAPLGTALETYSPDTATGNAADTQVPLGGAGNNLTRVANGPATSTAEPQQLSGDPGLVSVSADRPSAHEPGGDGSTTGTDAADSPALTAALQDVLAGRLGLALS